ncbi:MAG TPA: peptidase [Coleofasciculaceae cyanobacterium]
MSKLQFSYTIRSFISVAPLMLLAVSLSAVRATAQAQLYKPIPLSVGNPIKDTLSEKDIPTGQRGFARDYIVKLSTGDQVMVALSSDSFDTFVSLIAADGSVVEENDDGPDGGTNSLLVSKITRTDDYIIRVRASGETKAKGSFTLKVTRQRSE